MKQYKAVPGSKNIQIKNGDANAAVKVFEDIITREAVNGWQYHSMENISVTNTPGCFQQSETTYYYMLIFEKEVD